MTSQQAEERIRGWLSGPRDLPVETHAGFRIISNFLVIDAENRSVLYGYRPDPVIPHAHAPVNPRPPDRPYRFFWRSNSESIWRVGTGFDNGTGLPPSRYTKGQDETSGYIFETQAIPALQISLTAMEATLAAARTPEADAGRNSPARQLARDIIPNIYYGHPLKYLADQYVADPRPTEFDLHTAFLIGIRPANPGIMEPYREAVRYYRSGFAADTQSDLYRPPTSTGNIAQLPARPDLDVDVNHGQAGTKTLSQLGAITFQKNRSLARRLKSDLFLWSKLVPCLKNPPIATRTFHHAKLRRNVTLETYVLTAPAAPPLVNRPIAIEFAYTTGEPYNVNLPNNVTRRSRLCWINNIYFSDAAASSFGNFESYPSDLCFLAQKPMDYGQQINRGHAFYTKRSEPNQPGLEQQGSYASLLVLNEKYNYLIREFKKKKGFSRLFDKGIDISILLNAEPVGPAANPIGPEASPLFSDLVERVGIILKESCHGITSDPSLLSAGKDLRDFYRAAEILGALAVAPGNRPTRAQCDAVIEKLINAGRPAPPCGEDSLFFGVCSHFWNIFPLELRHDLKALSPNDKIRVQHRSPMLRMLLFVGEQLPAPDKPFVPFTVAQATQVLTDLRRALPPALPPRAPSV